MLVNCKRHYHHCKNRLNLTNFFIISAIQLHISPHHSPFPILFLCIPGHFHTNQKAAPAGGFIQDFFASFSSILLVIPVTSRE